MLFTSSSALVAGFTLLAALASPASASRIQWRHAGPGDSRRLLVTSNGFGSPDGSGPRNGTTFGLATDYTKYSTADWIVVKDELAQIKDIYTNPVCIDATLAPGNGVLPHAWTCYDGLYQQEWIYHSATGQIELGCSGLCLDVKDGYNGEDRPSAVQLWDCINGNKNQEWDIVKAPWET